jgi:hypothetical protein
MPEAFGYQRNAAGMYQWSPGPNQANRGDFAWIRGKAWTPNAYRVLVVGGSVAVGTGADGADRWFEVMERDLAKRLNRQRLEANAQELEAALLLVRKIAQNPELPQDAGRGLLDVVTRYARTFLLLQRYDDSAYAKKGQVGFNAWARAGGNLIDNANAVRVFTNSAT